MQYTTRLGDTPTEAHVNYICPCGCKAGLIYERDAGSQHMGRCCCGRLLWLGGDAEATVRAEFAAGQTYALESDAVRLPWGEVVTAVLAVPEIADAEHDHEHGELPVSVRDVVCGMMIDPRTAAATSEHNGVTYYFCALSCKYRFDAEPARFIA